MADPDPILTLDMLDSAIYSLLSTGDLQVDGKDLTTVFVPTPPKDRPSIFYPSLSFQPLKPESSSSRRVDVDEVSEYDEVTRKVTVRKAPIWYNLPYNIQYVDDQWYRWRRSYLNLFDQILPYENGGRQILLNFQRDITIEITNNDEKLDTYLFGTNYLLTVHDVPLFMSPAEVFDSTRDIEIRIGDMDTDDLEDKSQADNIKQEF